MGNSSREIGLNPGTAAALLKATGIVRLFSQGVELNEFTAWCDVLGNPFVVEGTESGEIEFGQHADNNNNNKIANHKKHEAIRPDRPWAFYNIISMDSRQQYWWYRTGKRRGTTGMQ